jgi:hypothetical protein
MTAYQSAGLFGTSFAESGNLIRGGLLCLHCHCGYRNRRFPSPAVDYGPGIAQIGLTLPLTLRQKLGLHDLLACNVFWIAGVRAYEAKWHPLAGTSQAYVRAHAVDVELLFPFQASRALLVVGRLDDHLLKADPSPRVATCCGHVARIGSGSVSVDGRDECCKFQRITPDTQFTHTSTLSSYSYIHIASQWSD